MKSLTNRTEAQMIAPVRELLVRDLRSDVVVCEFSAGYGFADLVGAKLCSSCCESREKSGWAAPLDHRHLVQVLLTLENREQITMEALRERVAISESTLRSKVLPTLRRMGLIEHSRSRGIKLVAIPPKPTEEVIAVEAKQTRWREAILQAKRYKFFADQSYIAVWKETVPRVDLSLLETHNLGLISVEPDKARVEREAPRSTPRRLEMSRFCAEYLYAHALNTGITLTSPTA
jgi:hypothetical protein